MTYYDSRLAWGVIFITVNFALFVVTIIQLYRSMDLCSSFSLHKTKLITRLLTTTTSILLLILAFLDVDFWLYYEDRNDIPDSIYIVAIIVKAFIDISCCITGSIIVYSIIYTYFVSQFGDNFEENWPKHVDYFWYSIAISFTSIVFLCLILSFSIPAYIFIRIYSDIRLFYLFLACLYMSYTFNILSNFGNQAIKKYKRNSVLLLIFCILSFFAAVGSIIYTIYNANEWNLRTVVPANIEEAENEGNNGKYFSSFLFILIGWLGYWFVTSWYITFVWVSYSEYSSTSRKVQTQNSITAHSPASFNDSQK